MRKLFTFLFFFASVVALHAQDFTGIDKLKEKSDADITDAKKNVKVATWMTRADVYLKIALDPTGLFSKLDDQAVFKADEALMKALELDKNDPKKPGKKAKAIAKMLSLPDVNEGSLRRAYLLEGQKMFEAKDYGKAQQAFLRAAEISDMPEVAYTDTSAYYNAAVAASNAGNYDVAVKYYQKSLELKYGGARTYSFLAKAMGYTADSAKVGETLKIGIDAFPDDNQSLMEELIDFYLKAGQNKEALAFLDKVIAVNPGNHIYYYVKGTLFDKQKEFDKAMEACKKSLEVKSDFYASYYNMGVIYYNKGRDFYLEANALPINEKAKYDATIAKAEAELKSALPLFEKAYELQPDDEATLQALKEVYYKLKMTDKYNEIKAKLDN